MRLGLALMADIPKALPSRVAMLKVTGQGRGIGASSITTHTNVNPAVSFTRIKLCEKDK